jgi:universal stress protein A
LFNIKNIIVPTDFSNLSHTAFEYAERIAEMADAQIHLLYVLDTASQFLSLQNPEDSKEKAIQQIEANALKQLSDSADEFGEDTSLNVIKIVRKGIDYQEIVGYSKEVGADMIVLATHGRSGTLHSLLGSVAENVIQNSPCPVLVIPPREEE